MIEPLFTVPLPTLRRADRASCTRALMAPSTHETLKLGCVICGSRHHGRLACPMAIDDDKTGATS